MRLKPPKGTMLSRGHPLARGMVGCWLMNEGTGNIVNDLSGNGNVGIITSALWSPGKFGPCVKFDGNYDFITIGDVAILEGMPGITVSAWINPSAVPSVVRGIATKFWDGTNRSWSLIINSTGNVHFFCSTDSQNDNDLASANGVVSANIWEHYVGVWSSGDTTIRLYRNGILQATTASQPGATVRTNTTKVCIGDRFYNGTNQDFFIGQIDDVMIYNRALSATEVQQLYMTPFRMFEREPIELWTGAYAPTAEDINIYVYDTE